MFLDVDDVMIYYTLFLHRYIIHTTFKFKEIYYKHILFPVGRNVEQRQPT